MLPAADGMGNGGTGRGSGGFCPWTVHEPQAASSRLARCSGIRPRARGPTPRQVRYPAGSMVLAFLFEKVRTVCNFSNFARDRTFPNFGRDRTFPNLAPTHHTHHTRTTPYAS